jgi:tRNA nucleotidyltransferase (CCA-adding enzyme)
MNLDLPRSVVYIIKTLTDAGYTAEIVGGAVRDLLLDKPTSDWDITTDATPEQVMPLFQESFYENQFGTVMIAQKHLGEQFGFDYPDDQGDLIFDITTYRSDGEYRNHRKPESVEWGKTITEDLKRRDFTINAMAIQVKGQREKENSKVEVELIDPYEGQKDLEAKLIRTVGNPSDRFAEDALRMLRAIRFAVQLGFVIEKETGDAIITHATSLPHISLERISAEFLKMMASDRPSSAIFLLDQFGLLQYILPELIEAKGVRQSGHHIYDVYEHSVRALDACTSTDPVVRIATLLHDIGKPVTARDTATGTVTFYNHEVVGARIAKHIAQRLRLPKNDCNRIFTLVRWHMFTYENFVTDAYIRRFITRIGTENLEDIFALRIGDRVGSGSKATSWRLEELKDRVWAELHQPMKVTDMAINGNDIMEALDIKPGPQIGKILNTLFEDVLEHPEHNTKEYLLEQTRALTSNL